jgi:hypothetical protein
VNPRQPVVSGERLIKALRKTAGRSSASVAAMSASRKLASGTRSSFRSTAKSVVAPSAAFFEMQI